MNSRTILGACLLVGLGCDPDASSEDFDETPAPTGKGDFPTGNATPISTSNGNLTIRQGYNYLYDKSHGQCVEPDFALVQGSELVIGEVSRDFEIVYVRSREELARELGIDLGLKVKYGETSGELGFDLLEDFSASTRKASFLVKMREEYFVRNKHPMRFSETGLAKLQAGTKSFVRACGTHYVNGLRFGAHVYALITYTADDESTTDQIRATMGVSNGPVPEGRASVDIEADFGARVRGAHQVGNVNSMVRVVSRGFKPNEVGANGNALSKLASGEIDEWSFDMLAQLRADMSTSVASDMCRDLGQCDPKDEEVDIEVVVEQIPRGVMAAAAFVPAAGYWTNTLRYARPTGVEIGYYDTLPNVPTFEGEDVFEATIDNYTDVERYVRDFAMLDEQMTVAYRNEIELFAAAPSFAKATFNLAPPATPADSPQDLLGLANTWTAALRPRTGSQVGTLVSEVDERIEDCWTKASVNPAHRCSPEGLRGKETEDWLAAALEIGQYHDEARILPLRYKLAGAVRSLQDAESLCSELDLGGDPLRVPTKSQVAALAPVIGYASVTTGGGVADPNTVWFRGADGTECDAGTIPVYRNDAAEAGPRIDCIPPDTGAWVACVPTTGPFPLETKF